MNGVATTPAARILGLAGAFLLIFSSATLGAYYGYNVGAHQSLALGAIFAAAALGGEILKPLAVAGAFDALRAREFLRMIACAGLAAVCMIYSFAAGLSLAAGNRGDFASARQLSADNVRGARERRTRASSELSGLAPARSAAELAPLIAKLNISPGANGCTGQPDTPQGRKACGDALILQSEAARAQRRADLEAAVAVADIVIARLSENPSVSISAADPLASALSAYLSALGRPAEADSIAPWLALVPVLFCGLNEPAIAGAPSDSASGWRA